MKVAVIGAGSAGTAIAGVLASKNHEVVIYNRSIEKIENIIKDGFIRVTGVYDLKGYVTATRDLGTAVRKDTELIMIATTSNAHDELACKLVPFLHDGQVIILNPGGTFGTINFASKLVDSGHVKDVIIGETESLIYAVRQRKSGLVDIAGEKKNLGISVLPSFHKDRVKKMLDNLADGFYPADFVVTSLRNPSAITHPPIMLANAEKIKKGERFLFYGDGATKEVCQQIEYADAERMAIAEKLGVSLDPLLDFIHIVYPACSGNTIYQCSHSNPAWEHIYAPLALDVRMLTEDVPYGLVPMSEAAKYLGVDTPVIDSLIDGTCGLLGVDYRKNGRHIKSWAGQDLSSSIEQIKTIGKISDLNNLKS
ncbi:MAG: NAD(P)-binding domain-containing protein [Desulfobacteraceae bacterium]|nr:NAD(P)-binding domain-containing protein [Desulfobacteraceae bacterium]